LFLIHLKIIGHPLALAVDLLLSNCEVMQEGI